MGFCLPAKALQLATGLLSEQRLPLVLDLDDTLVLGKTKNDLLKEVKETAFKCVRHLPTPLLDMLPAPPVWRGIAHKVSGLRWTSCACLCAMWVDVHHKKDHGGLLLWHLSFGQYLSLLEQGEKRREGPYGETSWTEARSAAAAGL